jgi:dihydroorotate dehydrogenase
MKSAYRVLFDLVLSKMDPEDAHHLAFRVIRAVPRAGLAPLVRRLTAPHPSLAVEALGLRFDSPFGVAAGFDKDARGIAGLGALGFGHVEVGTITTSGRGSSGSCPTSRSSTAWASTTEARRARRTS